MKKFYGVLFNRNKGTIVTTLEAYSSAMLKLFGMNNRNVSASRDFVVFDSKTGEIAFYCEGKKNDFPTICRDMEGKNIDDLCEGLREALELDEA